MDTPVMVMAGVTMAIIQAAVVVVVVVVAVIIRAVVDVATTVVAGKVTTEENAWGVALTLVKLHKLKRPNLTTEAVLLVLHAYIHIHIYI